jgi:hypothetical protein
MRAAFAGEETAVFLTPRTQIQGAGPLRRVERHSFMNTAPRGIYDIVTPPAAASAYSN